MKMSRERSGKNEAASILKNTSIVFVVSIAAKLLSLVRESTIAAVAGTSIEADAYYMVQGIYAVFEVGLSAAIFQSFFPIYKQTSIDKADPERRNRFANSAITLMLLVAVALGAIEILGRNFIVSVFAPGFSAEGKSLASNLIFFSAPMLLFVIAAESVSTILRSHDRFGRSQVRELGTHIAAIAMIMVLNRKIGYLSLGIGMLMGSVVRLVIQMPGLRKIYRFRPQLDIRNKDVKEMFRRIPATLITAGATQLKAIADRLLASMLSVGSVSALNYGHKIETALGGLISTAVATGLYPEMVSLQAAGENKKLRKLVDRSVSIFALLAIPLCVGCCFFGKAVVSLVYRRGAFGENEAAITAGVFVAYMAGTFFSGASAIISNIFYGAGDTKTPMKLSCIDLGLNVILNLLLYRTWGVIGLALATSASSVVTYSLRVWNVQKYLGAKEEKRNNEFLKIVLAALLSGVLCRLAVNVIPVESNLLVLIFAAVIMMILYVVSLFVAKSETLRFVVAFARKKLRREL